MTTLVRLALGCIGAAVPVLALAVPPNVTDITAVKENDAVRVSWTPLAGDIDAYHIFYSHASILGNGGLYDDFVSVDGSVTTHLLQDLPPVDELYVSILAVDANGDESPYFVEEAMVRLAAGETSSASNSESNAAFRLLSAEAVSATGVVLTFSHRVSILQEQAASAIMIDAGSGDMLQMRRFIIEGNTVTVHTVPQQTGKAYRVTLSQAVTGIMGENSLLLSSDQTPILFTGHEGGAGSASSTTSQPASTTEDVVLLRLQAQPDGDTYTVQATWQAPASGTFAAYSVSQTTDGGVTYGAPRTVNADTTAISIPDVPAGQFGVLVKTIGTDGMQSRGVAQVINLPPLTNGGSLNGSVTQPDGKGKGSLPNSGPALWLAVAGAGACAGAWDLRRRKKMAVA